jgi:two-component system, sensor histidine kinase and response regulator
MNRAPIPPAPTQEDALWDHAFVLRAGEAVGRVLVVEDNPVNQKVALKILEKLGHRVTLTDSGAAAIAELEQNRYDVVLMDCQMPEMDGFEATASIRALEQSVRGSRRIPIIALTAGAFGSDREKCLAAGMDGYLTKPIAVDVLARTVRAFLG